jgi:hypothetical protein
MITTHMGIAKSQLKEKAIALRQQGFSYREIMMQIPVAKSTIALWLRSVGLSKQQKQRLTEKKWEAIKRGAEAKHRQRMTRIEEIISNAQKEIGTITQRELWLMGIMLYWAEGSKEKSYRPGSPARFTNGDPDMICLFLKWLNHVYHKTLNDITIDLYIHEIQRARTHEIIEFWTKKIGCKESYFQHVYYKKSNPKTVRKNIGDSYHGILRIGIKSSSIINRQIAGWTKGVINCLR